jgi:hypothetical protein
MTTDTRPQLGSIFVLTLALSWTLVTTVIGVALWTDRASTLLRLASWVSLWVFTVVMPTVNAMTIHRAISGFQRREAEPRLEASLERLKSSLLLSANMALLSAFALMWR